MRLSQEDPVDPLARNKSSSNNSNNNNIANSSGAGSNSHGGKSSPLNIATYQHLAEAGVDTLELSDTDSSARSTADSHEKLNNTAQHLPTPPPQQSRQHQEQQQHLPAGEAAAAPKPESGLARGNANIPTQQPQARSSRGSMKETETACAEAPPRIKRQGAMSDLWQQQGAFRSNGKSMQSIFQEVSSLT